MEMQIENHIADIIIISKDGNYVWINTDELAFSREYRESYNKRLNPL